MKPYPRKSRSTAAGELLYAATLALALAAGGCASVSAPERSSTMKAFDQLSLQRDGTRAWRSLSAAPVGAVRIDPQAIAFGSEVRIDDEQRQALREALVQALTQRFTQAGLRVVAASDTAGDAIGVRATITAVELANPALNAVTTVLLLAPVSRGGVSVEIEALGANGGQRIAALAFSGTAGVNNLGSAYSGIGHAKLQADVAAAKFVALVTGAEPDKAS